MRQRLEKIADDACALLRAIGCHDLAAREETRPKKEWAALLPKHAARGPAAALTGGRNLLNSLGGSAPQGALHGGVAPSGQARLRSTLDGWQTGQAGQASSRASSGASTGTRSGDDGSASQTGSGRHGGQSHGSAAMQSEESDDHVVGGGNSVGGGVSSAAAGSRVLGGSSDVGRGDVGVPHYAGDWPGYGVAPGDGCARALPWLGEAEALHGLENTRGLHP